MGDTMRHIFEELDVDDDASIAFEELLTHMQDPEIGAYFSKLGIDVDQVRKIFSLLDSDKSGTIDKNEFVFGCLRLKGQAKSLDIAVLKQDIKWLRQGMMALGETLDSLVSKAPEQSATLENLRSIPKPVMRVRMPESMSRTNSRGGWTDVEILDC